MGTDGWTLGVEVVVSIQSTFLYILGSISQGSRGDGTNLWPGFQTETLRNNDQTFYTHGPTLN